MEDKYVECGPIATGGFGEVILAADRETDQMVAVKKITYDEPAGGVPISVEREISALQSMEHENIVKFLEVLYWDGGADLVFEYLNTDLEKYLVNGKIGSDIKTFLIQILQGVQYFHSHKILHRDLKPANLLIDVPNKIIKIADFGFAREFTDSPKSYTSEVQTLWYRAPEVLLGLRRYTTAIDMWSVGCIFAEMVNEHRLFTGDIDLQQLQSIISIMGTPSEETWPGVTLFSDVLPQLPTLEPKNLADYVPTLEPAGVDLLSKMLCLDPAQRISAIEALEHPYFNG